MVRLADECVVNAVARGLEWTMLKGCTWCNEHLVPSLETLFRARRSGVNPNRVALGFELLGDLLTIVEAYSLALRAYRRAQRAIHPACPTLFTDDIALIYQMAGKPREARREIGNAKRISVARGMRHATPVSFSMPSIEEETVWRGAVAEHILAGEAQLAIAQVDSKSLEQGWDLHVAAHAVLGHQGMVYGILRDLQRWHVPIWISPLVIFVLPDELREASTFWCELRNCAVINGPSLIVSDNTQGTGIEQDEAESFVRTMLDIQIARTAADARLLDTLITAHPQCSYLRQMHYFWSRHGRPPTWHEQLG